MKSILKKDSACADLAKLRPGQRGKLCSHAQTGLTPRLRDLGFVAGTPLEVLRIAPLGDPIEVSLRGYRLCLRRSDIATVCVTVEP